MSKTTTKTSNDSKIQKADIDSKKKLGADKKTTNKSPKKPTRWSILFIFLAFVIGLIGLGAAAYIWYEFEQYKVASQQSLQKQLADYDLQLSQKLGFSDVSKQIDPVVSQLSNQIASIEKAGKQTQVEVESVSESAQKLFELYGRDKNGWQLAEVEYLLRIAQHRLIIENDFQGADKTLKAADDKISEVADPGLLPVRIAISNDRVLLQSRHRPDLVSTVLSLSRIVKQLPHLTLKLNAPIEAATQKDSKDIAISVDETAPWQDQVGQFLSSLVKVEPVKKSIKEESAVSIHTVIDSIEEKLILAKWAVLERDENLYRTLVKQSSESFNEYADDNNTHHQDIKNELKRLLSVEIRPELPDISSSLVTLQDIMLRKEQIVNSIKENNAQNSDKSLHVKSEKQEPVLAGESNE